MVPLLEPLPPILQQLYNHDADTNMCSLFTKSLRALNSCFCMACSTFIDRLKDDPGPRVLQVQGQMVHCVGSVLPTGEKRSFSQIYIYDENFNEADAVRTRHGSIILPKAVTMDEKKHLERLLTSLQQEMDEHNPLTAIYRSAANIMKSCSNVSQYTWKIDADHHVTAGAHPRSYNKPTGEIIAGLHMFVRNQPEDRHLYLHAKDNTSTRVCDLHKLYDALAYPLLFPTGEFGWHIGIKNLCAERDFYRFRAYPRQGESDHLFRAGHLKTQFFIDMALKVENARLNWIATHQHDLRGDRYQNLYDAISGDDDARAGIKVVLPSSYAGSYRNLYASWQDSLAICRKVGRPDYFITFTANPKWPEIQNALLPGQKPYDREDLVVRVFHMKMQELLQDLLKKHVLGVVQGHVWVVEYQKRGLPHVHILLIVRDADKPNTPEKVDAVVRAEIPQKTDGVYRSMVLKHMLHGPCGDLNGNCSCMKNGECEKNYPKEYSDTTQIGDDMLSYPTYRRRAPQSGDERVDKTVHVGQDDIRWAPTNKDVVPHNRYLLLKYDAHINVEVCTGLACVKYLFKYCKKQPDKVAVAPAKNNGSDTAEGKDEVSMYREARWMGAYEAFWRLFGFKSHGSSPPVVRCEVHLPNQQWTTVSSSKKARNKFRHQQPKDSKLLAWFNYNKLNSTSRHLGYEDFAEHHIWENKGRVWTARKQGHAVSRMYMVPFKNRELWSLRKLCGRSGLKGCTCWEDLRTVNGVTYPTFEEAAVACGLSCTSREPFEVMEVMAPTATGRQLRRIFTTVLEYYEMKGLDLFNEYKRELSDDYMVRYRDSTTVTADDCFTMAAMDIEDELKRLGSDLEQISAALYNSDYLKQERKQRAVSILGDGSAASENREIAEALNYDRQEKAAFVQERLLTMNEEQRGIYRWALHLCLSQVHGCTCF